VPVIFRTPALIHSTYLGMYVSQQSAVASRYSSDETDGGYSTCIGHMLHTGTYLPWTIKQRCSRAVQHAPSCHTHIHSMVRSYYIVHRTWCSVASLQVSFEWMIALASHMETIVFD